MRLTTTSSFLWKAVSLIVGLAISVAVADADTYAITNSNFIGSGNFGTVTTTLVGNTIRVDVALAAGYVIHTAGVGFNVIDPDAGVTMGGFSAHFSTGPTGHAFDGFGKFEFSSACDETPSSARTHGTNTAQFTVSRTSGFTNASQLAEANSSGWAFAIQAAPVDPNAATGFFTAGPTGITAVSGTTWGRLKRMYR